MSGFESAQQFISRSRALEDFASLESLLDEVTRELGFAHYALIQHVHIRVGQADAFRLHSYPEDWAEQFKTIRRLSDDPIVLASCRTGVGFQWSDIADIVRLTRDHKRTLETAKRHGIGDGFTVPAHVPGEANGSCSFAQPIGKSVPTENLPAAQLVGTYAFQAARTILHNIMRTLPLDPVELTGRQLDCIALVAKGKSDWEIAQILGVKEETVSYHLDEARKRYDVVKRVQLVTRTLHDGHLTIADVLN